MVELMEIIFLHTLQWRHNEHRPHDCLLNCLFRRRSKKTSRLCVTRLCEENSLVTGEFPSQRASNAENVSIWWRHYEHPEPKTIDNNNQYHLLDLHGPRQSYSLSCLCSSRSRRNHVASRSEMLWQCSKTTYYCERGKVTSRCENTVQMVIPTAIKTPFRKTKTNLIEIRHENHIFHI